MLVEGARKQFPRESLDTYDLEIGKWVAILLIWVVLIFRHWVFKTLKKKHFISNCSTILLGNSMKTKYQSDVSHP